jgi:hypothetical protein
MAISSESRQGWARYCQPLSLEYAREILDNAPAPIVEIDVVLVEGNVTVAVYYRMGDNWDCVSFALPAPVDPESFRGAEYAELLTAPRRLH